MPPSQAVTAIPAELANPHVRLIGPIDKAFVDRFLDGVASAPPNGESLVVEVTTMGGDAELGRRLALEVRQARERLSSRLVFFGKTAVMSAGVSMMAAFPARDRFLSADTQLMIHGRQLEKTVQLSGPIASSRDELKALLGQIELGLELEREGFEELIAGSKIGLDELYERAPHNWYMRAQEALDRGLVAAIV